MGILDDKPVEKEVKTSKEDLQKVSDDRIKSWLYKPNNFNERLVCMVLGEDGTGKSGLVMDFISKKLREDKTAKAVIIDLDDGCTNLINFHKDVSDRLIVRNPLEIVNEGKVDIGYEETMNRIKEVSDWVNRNYEKENIKYFVFDGLSMLLKYAERQMRLEKNIDVDGGVQLRMWLKRNKDFETVLDLIKRMNISTFFIGHTDFILTEDSASIKQKTNAMMWQRIICESKKDKEGNTIKVAKITKSKTNPIKEDKSYVFMKILKEEVKFNSTKVFEGL